MMEEGVEAGDDRGRGGGWGGVWGLRPQGLVRQEREAG